MKLYQVITETDEERDGKTITVEQSQCVTAAHMRDVIEYLQLDLIDMNVEIKSISRVAYICGQCPKTEMTLRIEEELNEE